MPVRLVVEHSGEVTNDIDNTENETVLGTYGEVGAVCVTRDWCSLSSFREKFMHSVDGADLGGGGVDCEHADQDDAVKHSGVGA